MASSDVEPLFTYIQWEETINIFCDSLIGNETKIKIFSRNNFKKLLRMALRNNFNFDGKTYKQMDGVAMGSPSRPSLANAFSCFHEQLWLNDCPENF